MAVSWTSLRDYAVGAVIVLAVQSAWSWLTEGHRCRLDLKRRFFDLKLSITLESIREWRTSHDVLRAMLKSIDRSIDLPGPLNHLSLQTSLDQSQEHMREVIRATRNLSSVLDFFYGDQIVSALEKIESLSDSMRPDESKLLEALMQLKFSYSQKAQGSQLPGLEAFEANAHRCAKEAISAILNGLHAIDAEIRESVRTFRSAFRAYQG